MSGLEAHLTQGPTTLCRAWAILRRDGVRLGFTDHDQDLTFEGITFKASSGVTAKALQQSTGLSVDNSEAFGALSSAALSEPDILAGRYDGAEVIAWLVNWVDPSVRYMQFRGALGEIERAGGSFRAELRGLAERLNQPQGRVYQRQCAAVLGDASCRVDLQQPLFHAERMVEDVQDGRIFRFDVFNSFSDRWFEGGRFRVQSGAGAGLWGVIKNDRVSGSARTIELWQMFSVEPAVGDTVMIEAGCDKTATSCRLKFANFLNFRGFPHMPGEDWLMAYPSRDSRNDGGSLQ